MLDRYPVKPVAACIMMILAGSALADGDAEEGYVEFNPAFMSRGSQQQIDLKRYGHDLPPVGTYRADLIVNGRHLGAGDVTIRDKENDAEGVSICINGSMLNTIELDYDKLSSEGLAQLKQSNKEACVPIDQVLADAPESRVSFDSNELALNVELPQVMLLDRPKGYVNPELWDSGITAATLGYNMSVNRIHNDGKDYDTFFSNLNAGVNVMGWYVRHNGTYNWQNEGESRYNSLNTYVQRDIASIQGRLIFGDANTKGELFDTIAFRGVQLANEEQMLPDSQRGYAPVVRGTARTTAKVVIRQGGSIIYEKTVPPGPFEINDLYPTGYGGDLDVTIEEADGSRQNFQLPYASMSNLLRPGTHHYSLTYGKVRSRDLPDEPIIVEVTYRRGMTNDLTLYGGVQGNSDYQAAQGGVAIATPIGSFSFDVTQSNTQLEDRDGNRKETLRGQSYQAKYSQNILATKSNLSLAAYRFSTDNYMDFKTGVLTRESVRQGHDRNSILRPKNRLSVTANQQLPEGYGQFYINAYAQNYWNGTGSDRQYQVGYNNVYNRISYGISASRTRNGYGEYENTYMLNLAIPLDGWGGLSQMGINVNRGPGNTMSEQVFASGIAGNEDQYSYGLTASHTNNGGGSSGSFSASARTPYTTVQSVVGAGSGYQTYSASLSGSLVGHSGGLTLSPYQGETYALVEAKGAEGAAVSSYTGVKVDSRGYALVPYLSAYQMNEIEVNPKGTSANVELNVTSQKVAPYSGAVVKVKYDTVIGYPVLISANLANGNSLPFGADVYDMENNRVGVVGQGGRLFARVQAEQGRLKVSWGETNGQQCYISYLLPKDINLASQNILKFTSVCQ